MRSPRQQKYDNLYYKFELVLTRLFTNVRIRKKNRSLPADPVFEEAFRTSIRPYWKQFGIRAKRPWFRYYYNLTGSADPRYIPDDIHFYHIVPHFDDFLYMRPMEDKNFHSLLFPGVKRPETVFKKCDGLFREDDFTPLPDGEVYRRLAQPCRFIVKPTTDTGQGMDICFIDGPADRDTADNILSSFGKRDYIVQRILTQHPLLAQFNDSSVNTIRVVTLFFRGQAHILSAILRIGHKGSRVDNVSQGGYQASIRTDGSLLPKAYTHQNGVNTFVDRTDEGVLFDGFTVPSWDRISATALELASKLPHLQFIGWDFAVDENGEVILIEFNCQIGQNQENCGPTFGDLTDAVLSEVFHKESDIP